MSPDTSIRVAAIDIGTNSTRLLVADVEGGEAREVVRRSTVTRLGEGVDATRVLLPQAIARTTGTLTAYRDEAVALGATRILAVATSAARDAVNGAEFLADMGNDLGIETRLLSGDEEADLTRRGVGATAPGTLVLDVGGGSTELITEGFRTSLDVGSVRLTERFLHSDPPTASELEAASEFTRSLLPQIDVRAAIGVAGTVAQLYEIGGELSSETVADLRRRLSSATVEERAVLPGMDPARAPVIVGGAIVVDEVLRRYGLTKIAFSVRDILDGVALSAAD